MSDGGYDPVVVLDWLEEHCTLRGDGRFVQIGRQLLDDSHRDTFDRWLLAMHEDAQFLVPLGRLDEILMTYGLMIHDFENWAREVHGWDAYLRDEREVVSA